MTTPQLSIVIPAFNEEASLAATVAHVVASAGDERRLELVLVNDGSSDSTLTLMRSLAAEVTQHEIVVVDRTENGGMGQALASGCAVATGEVLTWIPGDGEYDLADVLPGIAMLDRHDIVLVRRTSRGQVGRNLLSSAMYVLIRGLFRFDARHYCGIFVVERQRFEELSIASRDVFFTLEVALRANHQRWRIGYIGAEWVPRRAGRSKVFNVRTVLRNVWELFAFRVQLFRAS
jgi:dolichol-phosphate mannosyltransferase